ncbi:MAG TPA: trypsin-like peptidase domain-containing protein [Pseudonocardiaceae bacterium]|nr:trypsin-like peptidase domain-containing protein [Pseudonocardiaceae bacterium]
MSEQPGAGPERADDRPRLGPRPIDVPSVDPHLASAFGRPTGVNSAFAPRNGFTTPAAPAPSVGPSPALATAFRRPAGSENVVLQRPPGTQEPHPETAPEPTYWSDGRDPWRDPGSPVMVGKPADTGAEPDASSHATAKPTGPLLSVPELLFGRRVKPSALAVLLVAALLIGAVGGVAGWALGSGGSALTDVGDTLTQTNAANERPPGSVAGITSRVAPAVVSLEVQAGTSGDVGSGVVIDPKGYLVTNNHVIAAAASGAGTITAVFSSGARVPATIVGRDPITDLAVLKVNATNLTVIKLGTSSSLRPGDSVIAIGSPLGLAGTVTSGIVSALNRPVLIPPENGGPSIVYDAIQTDAAINPGNSGGALVDGTGALVGINSANQTFGGSDAGQGGGSIGLGFAIPIDQATKIAQSLIRTGTVKHANLGASTRDVSANASLGAQVDNVVQGGAAAAAGIAEGDVITKFGGRAISSSVELQVAVLDDSPGQSVTVQFARQGQQHTVQVTLQSD